MIGDLLDDELSDVADLISLNTGVGGRESRRASHRLPEKERREGRSRFVTAVRAVAARLRTAARKVVGLTSEKDEGEAGRRFQFPDP